MKQLTGLVHDAASAMGFENKGQDLQSMRTVFNTHSDSLACLAKGGGSFVSEKTIKTFQDNVTLRYLTPKKLILDSGKSGFFSKEQWQDFNKQINACETAYQALLMEWNQVLTDAMNLDNFGVILALKRSVYKLLDKENLTKEVALDKNILIAWNKGLTEQAKGYFNDIAGTVSNKELLEGVFKYKKIIAKHLYALEAPQKDFELNFFEPIENAIERLKHYLTNPADGRYNNTNEYLNMRRGGIARSAKLAEALNCCDQIVLHQPLTRTSALNQGRLGGLVDGFMLSLAIFFRKFTAFVSSLLISPPATSSDKASPSSLLDWNGSDKSSNTSTSSPCLLSQNMSIAEVPEAHGGYPALDAIFNKILKSTQILTIVPLDDAYRMRLREHLIKHVNEYNAIKQPEFNGKYYTKCSELILSLAQVLTTAPFYEGGSEDLKTICAIEKDLVHKIDHKNPSLAIQDLMKGLSEYCPKKYLDLKDPNADKSKLFAAFHCFDLLTKDTVPEKTLETQNGNRFNGAFTRQGEFKNIITHFISARNKEKAKEQQENVRLHSNTNNGAFHQHQKRIEKK